MRRAAAYDGAQRDDTVESAFKPLLVVAACLFPATAGADQKPGKGKLLVATELVGGEFFAETVILLLHYDRFASREYALLVAVRFGLAQVFDHRKAHGFGCPESE